MNLRLSIGLLVAALLATAQPALASSDPSCPAGIRPGQDNFKLANSSIVYALNSRNELLYYPNGDVFQNWNLDNNYHNHYKLVSPACLQSFSVPRTAALGVNYRPGSVLIKGPYTDQLYAILPNNRRAEITPESAAALYGPNYKAVEIPNPIWLNYIEIEDQEAITGPNPQPHFGMVVRVAGQTYYVGKGNVLDVITAEAIRANRIRPEYIHDLGQSSIAGMKISQVVIDKEVTIISDRTQSAIKTVVNE